MGKSRVQLRLWENKSILPRAGASRTYNRHTSFRQRGHSRGLVRRTSFEWWLNGGGVALRTLLRQQLLVSFGRRLIGRVVYSTASLEELEVGPETNDKGNLIVAVLGSMGQARVKIEKEVSYDFGLQPGSVRTLNDGVVKIVGIAFVLIL